MTKTLRFLIPYMIAEIHKHDQTNTVYETYIFLTKQHQYNIQYIKILSKKCANIFTNKYFKYILHHFIDHFTNILPPGSKFAGIFLYFITHGAPNDHISIISDHMTLKIIMINDRAAQYSYKGSF